MKLPESGKEYYLTYNLPWEYTGSSIHYSGPSTFTQLHKDEEYLNIAWKHQPPEYQYMVYGVVTYKGKPVKNADVFFASQVAGEESRPVKTDDDGFYQIDTRDLLPRRYRMRVIKRINPGKEGWGTPDDLIDLPTVKERPNYFTSPLTSREGLEINFDVIKLKEMKDIR